MAAPAMERVKALFVRAAAADISLDGLVIHVSPKIWDELRYAAQRAAHPSAAIWDPRWQPNVIFGNPIVQDETIGDDGITFHWELRG